MSGTLTVTNLSAGHGERILFSGLDLVIAPGEITGLIGANGAGKSTLLRLLAGWDRSALEEGSITLSPPNATVGYLPQEPGPRTGERVLDFLARRTGVASAQQELDAATGELAAGVAGADDRYSAALDAWLHLGGADLEERAERTCAAVGLDVTLERPITSLSGGQAARANLASLLLSRHDILLLDEPTNDLDMNGLEILEGFLGEVRAGTVVVSHDRTFLERTVHHVLELDLAQGQSRLYSGGYASYLEERELDRMHAAQAYEQYAQTRSGLEDRMQTQLRWAHKGVREAKSKATDHDKIRLRSQISRSEKTGGRARATERMLERLPAVDEPRKEWQLRMEIAAAPRSSSAVATLRGAVVERGAFRLGPVDLQIAWSDRIAITGPNGSGKSTLIDAVLGRLELVQGHRSFGAGVLVGQVDQARKAFDQDVSLIEAFGVRLPGSDPGENRTLLAKFGLKAQHVLRPASSLSPGERTRAALALLQARGVNLLVLDEPTNHLDLPAIEQLESALATYPGTFLLVTHDRRMLEATSVTRRLAVDAGRVVETD